MQNKPNLLAPQMNLKSLITVDYENKSNWTLGENKPNQTQFLKIPDNFSSQLKVVIEVFRPARYQVNIGSVLFPTGFTQG